MADGPLDITLRVVAILDDLGIPYVLGGSLASSLVGEPRATADGDLAIRIDEEHVALYVLDVSGHGVAASLLSVTLSRVMSRMPDPSSLLRQRTERRRHAVLLIAPV